MTPEQLKSSILQYAIQGKLVEQRPDEGTAEELYKQIQGEKQKLIKEGTIKKEKPIADITEEEIPYDIPNSWKWVRFAEFGSYKKGPFGSALTKSMFVPKGENTIKVYEQKNAIQKDATLGEYYITKEYYEDSMSSFEVCPGDVIVSCAGTIGETYIMPENIEKGIINQALMRMQLMPSVYKPYFLMSFDVVLKKNAIKSSKGSAIKNIPPFDELKAYLVPLPPLAEQKRIVAKIEELLPFVDRYAEAYEKLEKFNAKFPEDMKKSILQYAIQGKLVEQRPEEGTAEELYKEIQEEKQKLIKEGKIKKEKPLAEITEDEIPFDIPNTWKWCYLGEIFTHTAGKALNAKNTTGEKHKYITTSNVYWDHFELDNLKEMYYTEDEIEKYSVQYGDLLVLEGGDVGRTAIWDLHISYCIQNHIHRLRPYIEINIKYFYYVMMYLKFRGDIAGKGIGIKGLSANALHCINIPLPPLEEQHRIVAKLEELLPYCDQLIK